MKNIFLPISLTIFTFCYCDGQDRLQNYLLGRWQSVDSSTGKRSIAEFKNNKTLIFDNDMKYKWDFTIQGNDSIISVEYKISSKKVILSNEGTLIIKNNNCLWWFNPNSYKTYILALQKGYDISRKKEFDKWVRQNKDVYYRLKTSRH